MRVLFRVSRGLGGAWNSWPLGHPHVAVHMRGYLPMLLSSGVGSCCVGESGGGYKFDP